MQRPERLWDQYVGKAYSEAARGMGLWPLQPHPCDLEPPWDAFDRRSLTLWDCMLHGWEAPWEGSWLNRLLSPGGRVHDLNRPVVLPHRQASESGQLVPVVVEQFPDDETTIPKAEEFLRSLPHLNHPISFEIIGVGAQPEIDTEAVGRILSDQAKGIDRSIHDAIRGWKAPYTLAQFVADRSDARRVERQLLAHYPNSAVVVRDDLSSVHDDLAAVELRRGDGYAATLALQHPWCFPLRTFLRLDPDPLGVVLAAMDHLEREEWAMLQILFQPAEWPWAGTLEEAISDPYNEKNYLLPDISDRILREKFSTPLFAVSVRFLASRRDVFRQFEGWAEQFSAPPQGLWINDCEWGEEVMPRYERQHFADAIEYRCTHRPGLLLNTRELSGLVHLPAPSVVSERLRRVKTRTKQVAETQLESGSVLLGENIHRGRSREARLPASLRERHCYLAGASGTGKSTLLLNMIMQDIEAGHGAGLLDPHGDLVNAVLQRIPEHRMDDVILFDPADDQFPFALNILDADGEKERERIVEETLMSLRQNFPDSWGPRLQRILTFTLATVLDAIPHATLADVEQMLIDEHFRNEVVARTRNSRYEQFWRSEFAFLAKNAIDPVLNKLSVFLLNRTVRNIICQRRTAINFDDVINRRKILLANLSVGNLTEEISSTFGSFLVTKLVNAAFRRAAIPHEERQPWYLYVDEFQAFMNLTIGFERILAEARKYRLVLAGMANQYVGQLSPPVRQAIFGNIGTMIVFRLGMDDARTIAKEMGVFTDEEIMNLEVGQAIARAGGSSTSFNLRTFPAPPIEGDDPTPRIVAQTRRRYARPRQEVEQSLASEEPATPADASPRTTSPGRRRKGRRRSPPSQSTPRAEPRDPNENEFIT